MQSYVGQGPYTGSFRCKWCDHKGHTRAQKLREHVHSKHEEVSAEELERHLVLIRYPDLELDNEIQRYRDRLETLIGLQRRGIFIKKYLKTIGVLRNWRADLAILAFVKPGMQTAEEVRQAMTDGLVNKFRNASPEARFEGYLNRDLSVLKKSGHEDLIPAVRALKIINFTKNQLDAALEEAIKESQAHP
jgi:hypothetical protein